MREGHKLFIDAKPIVGQKEDFDLKRLKDVYQDLTDYLGMPIEEVSRIFWDAKETTDKEEQKLIENASSEKEVIEYYRTTRRYLYELTLWEARKDKQREFKKLYLFCKQLGINKILDFGAGTGGLCIYFNNRGLDCDYLDIPGETYNFARWRFNRHRINSRVFNAFENTQVINYQAVIAYDVFEHIFDLPGAVKKINSCLIDNGYLISKSTFSGGGAHLLKNEIYQNFKIFNELLSNNGFDFVSRLKANHFSRMLNKIGFRYFLGSIRLSKRLKHGGNFIVHRKKA